MKMMIINDRSHRGLSLDAYFGYIVLTVLETFQFRDHRVFVVGLGCRDPKTSFQREVFKCVLSGFRIGRSILELDLPVLVPNTEVKQLEAQECSATSCSVGGDNYRTTTNGATTGLISKDGTAEVFVLFDKHGKERGRRYL
uniref:Uncharacterized protein n=1 Tax=Cacopsylla melanoneura TaxID=428564 RepID=A0A8D8QIU9_9HEMI